MMRVCLTGGGGLSAILAEHLSQTSHAVLLLSNRAHPEFEVQYGCQVAVVDYANVEQIRYTLQGVDVVISTIGGANQISLIDAARRARVRCFVPSEFEGALAHRPGGIGLDPLDHRGSAMALEFVQSRTARSPASNSSNSTSKSTPPSTPASSSSRSAQNSNTPRMRITVFSCGVFYERLAPGGLAAFGMGGSTGAANQGDYLVDLGALAADIPETNREGRPVYVTMTAVHDVARAVVGALDVPLQSWPSEFRIRGAHLPTRRLVEICENVRGVSFDVTSRTHAEIQDWLGYYEENDDAIRWYRMQVLLQTANGRFSFTNPNLNGIINFQPMGIRAWLTQMWGPTT